MKLPILEECQKFNPVFEGFCKQNCLQQVLKHYGVKNSFQYMDTALNLVLYKLDDVEDDYDVDMCDLLVHEPYRKNLKRYQYENVNPMDIWLKNKDIILEGMPIIVDMDLYEMEYSKTHNIYHNKHSVILCGCEDENPVIKDCYQWKFEGMVPLEQFLKARNSECPFDDSPYSGMPVKNSWIYVGREGWEGDMECLLKMTISKTLTEYYGHEDNCNGERFYGIYALHKLAEFFSIKKDMEAEVRSDFLQHIRKLALHISAQLNLYRYYIAKASEQLNLLDTKEIIEELSYDAIAWNSFSVLCVKGVYNKMDTFYAKIEKRLLDLIETEEKRYEHLIKLERVL